VRCADRNRFFATAARFVEPPWAGRPASDSARTPFPTLSQSTPSCSMKRASRPPLRRLQVARDRPYAIHCCFRRTGDCAPPALPGMAHDASSPGCATSSTQPNAQVPRASSHDQQQQQVRSQRPARRRSLEVLVRLVSNRRNSRYTGAVRAARRARTETTRRLLDQHAEPVATACARPARPAA